MMNPVQLQQLLQAMRSSRSELANRLVSEAPANPPRRLPPAKLFRQFGPPAGLALGMFALFRKRR
jgi:hypothetical protein